MKDLSRLDLLVEENKELKEENEYLKEVINSLHEKLTQSQLNY